jgi:hypothetical protein
MGPGGSRTSSGIYDVWLGGRVFVNALSLQGGPCQGANRETIVKCGRPLLGTPCGDSGGVGRLKHDPACGAWGRPADSWSRVLPSFVSVLRSGQVAVISLVTCT